MTSDKIAICTSAYPIDAEFLADYGRGIAEVTAAYPDAFLAIAAETNFERSTLLEYLPDRIEVLFDGGGMVAQPALLRRRMISLGVESGADLLVFVDLDDRLADDALESHVAALSTADISYGDLIPTDISGRPYARTFFESAEVPNRVCTFEPLLKRNFIGFSNSAVRRTVLDRVLEPIPAHVKAADWWFFSQLLMSGAVAQRTTRPVVYYRNYAESLLGSAPAASVSSLLMRARMALAHCDALALPGDLAGWADALSRLIAALETEPAAFSDCVAASADTPGVWFDDVGRAVTLNETRQERPVVH